MGPAVVNRPLQVFLSSLSIKITASSPVPRFLPVAGVNLFFLLLSVFSMLYHALSLFPLLILVDDCVDTSHSSGTQISESKYSVCFMKSSPISLCVHVWTFVFLCAFAGALSMCLCHRGQSTTFDYHFSGAIFNFYLRQGHSLARNSTSRLGWPGTESQESTCLCLSSSGVI